MGVHGLWQLLQPVARPIALESMGNKRLAIDSSIWLYQFQLAMRDKEGRALDNAHVLGFLRRITKLLFYGIKPVFVFDGGAPTIKRVAISERKKRKRGGADNLAKTAEKLLAAQLRAAAVDDVQRQAGQSHMASDGSGARIGDHAVFLEDLGPSDLTPSMVFHPRRGYGDTSTNDLLNGDPEPPKLTKKKKYVHKDQYQLPALDTSLHDRAQHQADSDPRIATDTEMRNFLEELKPEDFDMESEMFAHLPIDVKYEIIGDLRIKSRQTNRRRVEAMRGLDTPLDFSKAQVANLMTRNDLTQKLLAVTDTISQAHVAIPLRVAGERNREYMLVKNDNSLGGGWILGTHNVDESSTGSASQPVRIDTTTDASDETDSSAVEFESVNIPDRSKEDTIQSTQRTSRAIEALRQRYLQAAGVPARDPYLDQVLTPSNAGALLFGESGADCKSSDLRNAAGLANDMALIAENGAQRPSYSEATNVPSTAHQGQSRTASEPEPDDLDFVNVLPSISESGISQTSLTAAVIRESPVSGTDQRESRAFSERSAEESSMRPLSPLSGIKAAQHAAARNTRPQLVERHSSTGVTLRDYAQPANRDISSAESGYDASAVPPAMSDETDSKFAESLGTIPSSAPPTFVALARLPSSLPLPASSSTRNSEMTVDESTGFSDKTGTGFAVNDHYGRISSDKQLAAESATASCSNDARVSDTQLPTARSRSVSPADDNLVAGQELKEAPNLVHKAFPLAEVGHELSDEDIEDADDANVREVLEQEQSHFSRLLSDLQTRNLDEMREEAETEIRELARQRKRDRRAADDITQQMAQEIQTMLRLFGIPFVTAPMEAEAQCAEMLARGLVDGIITDDSDVFLFGGSRIYKNMFNQNKYVECYLLADLERELSLDRLALIRLAHYLGSDYTNGLPGVGPVLAMELMSEFPGPDGLYHFRDWWRKVQTGTDASEDTDTSFRRKFASSLAVNHHSKLIDLNLQKKGKKDLYLDESWPSVAVQDAYMKPSVDSSTEKFTWALPDLDGLRIFLAESLGWNLSKVDDLLKPLIKRMAQRAQGVANVQGTLDHFFDQSAGTGNSKFPQNVGYKSARLQNVLKVWRDLQKRIRDRSPLAVDSRDAPLPDFTPDQSHSPMRTRPSVNRRSTLGSSTEARPTQADPDLANMVHSTSPSSRTFRRGRGRRPSATRRKASQSEVTSDDSGYDSVRCLSSNRGGSPEIAKDYPASQKAQGSLVGQSRK